MYIYIFYYYFIIIFYFIFLFFSFLFFLLFLLFFLFFLFFSFSLFLLFLFFFFFSFFFFSSSSLGLLPGRTRDRRFSSFVGPFRPRSPRWRSAAEGGHSPGYGEAWPTVDCDRRHRKNSREKRPKQRSLFRPKIDDIRHRRSRTKVQEERKGREEGKEDLPRPPVTPSASNHGKSKTVSAAPIGKNSVRI